MAELLDFEKHFPEEYEGKLISLNNCQYEISSYVGSGLEKFIHKLINLKSGLCLHIIKVYRNKEAENRSNNEKAAFLVAEALGFNTSPDRKGMNFVPEILTTKIGETTVAIEEFIGPYESDMNETHKLMNIADESVTNGNYRRAIEYYGRVLELNEFHTVALNNISYSLNQLNKAIEAFDYQYRATIIEPNYSEYRKNLIEYAAACGRLGGAENHFNVLKEIFPYYNRIDELMIQVFISIGKPERVKELSIYQNRDFSEKQEVDKAILTKEKAEKIVAKAKSNFFDGKFNKASTNLKNAYKIYSDSGLHKVNLAFCNIREGKYKEAINLLMSSINLLHYNYSNLLYLNIGLCFIKMKDYLNAQKYLEGVFYMLSQGYKGKDTISIEDLPGIGMWIDETGTLEEPLESSFTLIHELWKNIQKKEEQPLIENLLEIYEKAYIIQEESMK